MTTEALALKGALAAYNALVKFFTDLGNRETDKLLEAVEIDRRSHHAQVAQHVKVLMVEWAKLAKDAEELRAKIEEMAADSQFQRLHANLEYEAVRSTLDERKKMLAAAAAGLCNPRMSIEDKARVERTLRELDPKDVQLLERLRVLHADPHQPPDNSRDSLTVNARDLLAAEPLSRGALLTAGCVRAINRVEKISGALYAVSELGDLVLRVLATYLNVGQPGADE